MAQNFKQTRSVQGDGPPSNGDALCTNLAIFPIGIIYVDSLTGVLYVRDTANLDENDWISGSGGPGGDSLLPTTGTGTATGNVTGDLDGNTLSLFGGNSGLSIDPSVFTSSLSGGDGTASSSFSVSGDLVGTNVGFSIGSNDGSNSISIVGNAIAETLVYSADSHTFTAESNESLRIFKSFVASSVSDDVATAGFDAVANIGDGNVRFQMNANDGTANPVQIKGDGQLSTITYTADNHIFATVQVFADNAAAVTGGLAVGTLYRTGDALKIVH